MIYSTTADLTEVVNDLVAEGLDIEREDLATISPYITSRTRRFGFWQLDLTPPASAPGRLALPDPPAEADPPAALRPAPCRATAMRHPRRRPSIGWSNERPAAYARRQVLRAATPLRLMAQHPETGPIPWPPRTPPTACRPCSA